MKKSWSKLLALIVSLGLPLAFLAGCSRASTPQATSTPSTATSTPSVTDSPSETTTLPTPTFTPNGQLSDQQNLFVEQIMELNGYSQETAEAVLASSQSICNLLDSNDPTSLANQNFLTDMFQINQDQGLVQEWYNNVLVATQNLCPEKTDIVKANKPETATDPA